MYLRNYVKEIGQSTYMFMYERWDMCSDGGGGLVRRGEELPPSLMIFQPLKGCLKKARRGRDWRLAGSFVQMLIRKQAKIRRCTSPDAVRLMLPALGRPGKVPRGAMCSVDQ